MSGQAGSRNVTATDMVIVQRISAVLDAFTVGYPERTVSEIARATALSTSTAHRILSSLTTAGLLERPIRGRYRLGLRMHELGQTAVYGIDLRDRALTHLEALRAQVGHTIQLSVLSGIDVVYIHRLEDPSVFGRFVKSGQRVPAYASSSGKVLLAFATDPTLLDAIASGGLVRRAPRTITDMRRLRDELEHVRERGYAESVEETWPNMASIAVPVFDHSGAAIAAISIAGSLERYDGAARARAARLAVASSRRLTKDLADRRNLDRDARRAVRVD